MITIKDVLQFNVARCSEAIRAIKAGALKTEPAQRCVFVSPEGTVSDVKRDSTGSLPPGWKAKFVEYAKPVVWMSPRHAAWPEYLALKAETSQWLTAVHLLKLGGGTVPLKKDVRKAIRSGGLQHHISRRKASAIVFSARALLEQRESALNADPASFSDVERFVAARQKEAGHARE